MQAIEVTALKNYEENLQYLKLNHKDLFKKLQIFDLAEAENKLVPKYDLEYKDEGYFDVKNIEENSYLYDTNSLKYAKKIADEVNYKKTTSLFNGLIDYEITQKQIDTLSTIDKLKGSNIRDLLPIMSYAMKIAPKTTTMKKIDKFIFVGVGIGTHISSIDSKIQADEYLIIEDNLELFRLSLFVTPYYEIAKNANLYFSVSQNETDFTISIVHFLEGSFFNNRYLKYSYFPAHSKTKLKFIQNNIASQNCLVFPYDILLQKFLRPLKRIKKGYKTINIFTKFPESILSEKPLLILAAGPSLKKNMDFLLQNANKFIIVAVTAVLKTLHDNNIVPDIVTHIDGIETEGNSCMVHFEGFDAKEFLKDSLFILGYHTPDSLLALLNKDNVFFYETSTFYFNEFGTLSTPCVGTTSVVLSLWLNAKEIYLLGLDLAMDQETGETHSGAHEYNHKHDLAHADEIDYTISLRNNLIPIKGNLREKVLTTPLFHVSVRSLNTNLSLFKDKSQTIYNLNDGAYFEGAEPFQLDNIPLNLYSPIEKKELHSLLYDILNSRARKGLNASETNSLHHRLENAQYISNTLKEYKNKKFTNEINYLYDLLGVVSSILKLNGKEGNNLSAIYASFFQYSMPYIMDVINTKEITQKIKHLKKIDAMFVTGCFSIINYYTKEVEEFFKK